MKLLETIACFPTLIARFDMAAHPCERDLHSILESSESRSHALVAHGSSSHGCSELLELPTLKKLREDIQAAVNLYVERSGLESLMVTSSWFNILERNGRVAPHRHPSSVVSGAYYPFVEQGSVALSFESPLLPCRMSDAFARDTEFTISELKIPVQQGLLVVFPSWLVHYTDANDSVRRVTVSFNTTRRRILDSAMYFAKYGKVRRMALSEEAGAFEDDSQ